MATKMLPILAIGAVAAIAMKSKSGSKSITSGTRHGVSISGCNSISIVNKRDFMSYIDSVAKAESKTDLSFIDVSKKIFNDISSGSCFKYPDNPQYSAEYFLFSDIVSSTIIALKHYGKDIPNQDDDDVAKYLEWMNANANIASSIEFGTSIVYDDLNYSFGFGPDWINSILDDIESNSKISEDELRIKIINSAKISKRNGTAIKFADIPGSDRKTEFTRAVTCFIRMYRKYLANPSLALDISHYLADHYKEFYNCAGLEAPKGLKYDEFFTDLPYRSSDWFIFGTGAYDILSERK